MKIALPPPEEKRTKLVLNLSESELNAVEHYRAYVLKSTGREFTTETIAVLLMQATLSSDRAFAKFQSSQPPLGPG